MMHTGLLFIYFVVVVIGFECDCVFSSIEYVGIQTLGGKQTDFSEIKATIMATLENNKIRSPRRLSVIFKALKVILPYKLVCSNCFP
jgi:hypothetical protein